MQSQATPSTVPPMRLAAFVWLFASGVLLSGLVGGLSNSINGAVSPAYFVTVLGWYGVSDVWRASIGQGVFEGLILGTVLSLVFTTVVGLISRVACPYPLGLRYVLGLMVAVCGCWMVGGIGAVLLSLLSPEFYRDAFIGVPSQTGAMVRYAWVGGSIMGAECGSIPSLILTLVVFRAQWGRRQKLDFGPHSVPPYGN